MRSRYHTLLAAGVVASALTLLFSLRQPDVTVSVLQPPTTPASSTVQATSSALAEAPPALRERLLNTLLHAAQRSAANAMDQGLVQLHWRESEWLADPATGLTRLQQQCSRILAQALMEDAKAADIQQLCQAQSALSLASQFSLSEEQARHVIAVSLANPQQLQQFQQDSPLSGFSDPQAFFEAYWSGQDALYGAQLAEQIFGAQREGMRFEQRFQGFLRSAQTLTTEQRLSWYQQQQQAFRERYGQPLSALSSDQSDELNRLIALHELEASDDPVERRYQLRRALIGEEKASRWRQREQRQWQAEGQLPQLYAAD